MATRNTYRILIWIIVILVAGNLSMGLSFWYHRHMEIKVDEEVEKAQKVEMPSEQRARFFRDQLNLSSEQLNVFRELNREFNQSARKESNVLEDLRTEMVKEMVKASPSAERLDSIALEVGRHHSALKKITISYYLKMKAVCNSEQQKKLADIFLRVSSSEEELALPERGRKYRNGRTNKN